MQISLHIKVKTYLYDFGYCDFTCWCNANRRLTHISWMKRWNLLNLLNLLMMSEVYWIWTTIILSIPGWQQSVCTDCTRTIHAKARSVTVTCNRWLNKWFTFQSFYYSNWPGCLPKCWFFAVGVVCVTSTCASMACVIGCSNPSSSLTWELLTFCNNKILKIYSNQIIFSNFFSPHSRLGPVLYVFATVRHLHQHLLLQPVQ